ncbi:CDGP domain-containing protein [Mycobacterium sp. WMMD1722]|uniref:CDGP domain-containing protein n=1 Tax=Mycobacterium sp. WMMD1722 TaxID=3404117 RepID=UPI003BF463CD
MKRGIVAGSAVVLMAGGLSIAGALATAPTAGAGCLYGGDVISKCDGPVQPDGTWQRCAGVTQYVPSGFGSHLVPVKICDLLGPGRQPADARLANPPAYIN